MNSLKLLALALLISVIASTTCSLTQEPACATS